MARTVHPGRIEWADVVVVGNGMVGHRFVESLVERDASPGRRVVVIGEEHRRAYDRVHLSSLFDGVGPDELALGDGSVYERKDVDAILGDRVTDLDAAAHQVVTEHGRRVGFGACVVATGSSPFVPPIPGTDAAGVFVYRTIDDLDAIREWASGAGTGVVIGGGLLGLEAANALRLLGVATTIVEFGPHLMAVQLDPGAGRVLAGHVEGLGLAVRTGVAAQAVRVDADGRATAVEIRPAADDLGADVTVLPADVVVVAAGIRPRDELGRRAGLAIGARGGIVVDDECRTSAPDVYAIGEVACHRGRVYGLVGPGYTMAEVVADRLSGGSAAFSGPTRRPRSSCSGSTWRSPVTPTPTAPRSSSPTSAPGSGSARSSTPTGGCSAPPSSATPRAAASPTCPTRRRCARATTSPVAGSATPSSTGSTTSPP